MCELGRQLREGREAKGLELGQVAEVLRVRRVTLEALEECRFSDLPEPTLARGYLKHYAQLLQLDPIPLLALYPSNITEVGTTNMGTSGPNTALPQGSSNSRAWLVPLLLLFAVLVWVGVSWFNSKPKPTVVQTAPIAVRPPPPQQVGLKITSLPLGAKVYLDGFLLGQAPLEARVEVGDRTLRLEAPGFQKYEQTLPISADRNLSISLKPLSPATQTPSTSTATTANPTNPATPTTGSNNGLVLRMVGRSWIRVVDAKSGQGLYEGIPAKGSQLSFPLPALVRSGNAGAIEIVVNGQSRGLMGKEGQVASQRYGQ